MVVPPGTNLSTLPHVTGVFNLVAFLVILVVTAVLVIGIQESANFNTLIVIVKLTCVFIFLVLGINFLFHHPGPGEDELAPVHSAKDADGELRHQRHCGGRGIGVLRVYRVRRGVDGGAGGEESRSAICRSAFWARW